MSVHVPQLWHIFLTPQYFTLVAWRQVQASSLYPAVMKYLPSLLPRQFTELFGVAKKSPKLPATQGTEAGVSTQQDDAIQQEEEEEDWLAKLEDIIVNDVWKLGFNSVRASF